MTGTPLAEWPLISRAEVEELAYFKVRSVEQLAEISDGNARNIGPILALRQKARDWLEKASGGALESKLRSLVDQKDSQIEALRNQMAELTARVEKQGQHQPKGK